MFSAEFTHGNSKSKYCKCLACEDFIIAAAGHLRDHWAKCKKRLRTISQLDAGFQLSWKSSKSSHSSEVCAGSQKSCMMSSACSMTGDGTNTTENLIEPLNSFPVSPQFFDSQKARRQNCMRFLLMWFIVQPFLSQISRTQHR